MEFYHLNGSQFAERVEMVRGKYSTLDNSYCHECLDVHSSVDGVDLRIKGRLADIPRLRTFGAYKALRLKKFLQVRKPREIGARRSP